MVYSSVALRQHVRSRRLIMLCDLSAVISEIRHVGSLAVVWFVEALIGTKTCMLITLECRICPQKFFLLQVLKFSSSKYFAPTGGEELEVGDYYTCHHAL